VTLIFGGGFFILLVERGVMPKERLWMVRHKRIGGSAFQTPYLVNIIKKGNQERDIGQGLRKT